MSLNSSDFEASDSGGIGNSGGSTGGSPCGACKFLRRKCVQQCIFAPYFDSEHGAPYFAAVHKVFGASNVSKLLLSIPMSRRHDAVISICYEAGARLRDPVYGCVGHIIGLQQQVNSLQAELSYLQSQLSSTELSQLPPPPPPQVAPAFSFVDPPPVTTAAEAISATYDLSSLFDPMGQTSSWAMQQRANIDPRQHLAAPQALYSTATTSAGFQAVAARELHRNNHVSPSAPPARCSNDDEMMKRKII